MEDVQTEFDRHMEGLISLFGTRDVYASGGVSHWFAGRMSTRDELVAQANRWIEEELEIISIYGSILFNARLNGLSC